MRALRRRYGRALHSQLTRATATPVTRVRVVEDSMYRGWVGTIVTPDARRMARIGSFNQRLLTNTHGHYGTVMGERDNSDLFVVPASYLEPA